MYARNLSASLFSNRLADHGSCGQGHARYAVKGMRLTRSRACASLGPGMLLAGTPSRRKHAGDDDYDSVDAGSLCGRALNFSGEPPARTMPSMALHAIMVRWSSMVSADMARLVIHQSVASCTPPTRT